MALDTNTINLNALISMAQCAVSEEAAKLYDMRVALLNRIESGESDTVEVNGKHYRLVPIRPAGEEVPFSVLAEKLKEALDKHIFTTGSGPAGPPTLAKDWRDHTHLIHDGYSSSELGEPVGDEHTHYHRTFVGPSSPPILTDNPHDHHHVTFLGPSGTAAKKGKL